MGFPAKLLNDAEQIVLDLRPHWSRLALPVAASVLGLGILVAALVAALGPAATIAAAVLAGLGLLWFLARYARWRTTTFTVTTDRIIYRSGVLAKQGREMPLDRLNDISFHQGIFERMIGAGDLVLESAGERGQETFSDIPRPARVQNTIYREMERSRGRQAERGGTGHELSLPEQLEKLDELRRRGVLSDDEFAAKKAELLERM